jgi:hypothetical protein
MRRVAAIVAVLTWALWFGGLMALFIFVQTLFREDRSIALEAAPRMFSLFEKYQLALAAAALIATLVWRIVVRRAIISAIFFLFAVATLGAVAGPVFISGEMQKLRAAGQSSGARFHKLHGQSMIIYVSETVVLLAAGVLLPIALTENRESPLQR